jgi:ABC-type phosphate/phosphonate transport system substrate-binding protein
MKLLHSVSLTFAAVATAAALSLSSCGDQPAAANDGATVLRFTAIPDHNSTDLESKYKPVAV